MTARKTAKPRPWTLEARQYPNGEYSARPYIYDPDGPEDGGRYVCEIPAEKNERSGGYRVTPLAMERARYFGPPS